MISKINTSKAFTLIELVIYLAIFSIFSLLVFGYASKFYRKIFTEINENKTIIRNSIIIDLLKRDLISASSSFSYWDEKDFVFRKKHLNGAFTDISWQMRKDGVYRLLGKYDFIKRRWLKKNVARLDFEFYKFSFFLNKDATSRNVQNVSIFLDDKEIIVCLRNKSVLL